MAMSVSVLGIRLLGAAVLIVSSYFTMLSWQSKGTTVGHDLFPLFPIACGVVIIGLGLLFLQRWAAVIVCIVVILGEMGFVWSLFIKGGPPIWAGLISMFVVAIPAMILVRGWRVLR